MIPAGYQLYITTWENDADAYQTEIISGLAKEEVEFYLEIAKRFTSKNGTPKGLGNGSTTGEQLEEVVRTALANHPNISDELRDEVNSCFEDEEHWVSHLYGFLTETILGSPVNDIYCYDYKNFCRVFDAFKVFYFPEAVQEVTSEFAA